MTITFIIRTRVSSWGSARTQSPFFPLQHLKVVHVKLKKRERYQTEPCNEQENQSEAASVAYLMTVYYCQELQKVC